MALFMGHSLFGQKAEKSLILQEMSWVDVQNYLKTSDMVIIPLGSTEQHGPHLPLGTDYYAATGMAKMISARTGVVVAPVVLAGYSIYHSGFPGVLSLKPETLEQVLFETAEMLIKYGFRRIMFFNYHGGNKIAESNVIYRINQTTEAIAVAIGTESSIHKEEEEVVPLDWHAGISETSMMLFLQPDLVNMERAEKPKMNFTPRMQELLMLAKTYPGMMMVWNSLLGVPEETKKGGSSYELSSNGIWSLGDPKKANKELGEKAVKRMVDEAVEFIETWKKAKN
jgi:creatinine amidohydrolase